MRYQKAHANLAKLFDCSPDDTAEKNRISVSCYLNTAQCYLKGTEGLDKEKKDMILKKVVRACDSALEIDEKNIKALYRKALALEGCGEIQDSKKMIVKGLEVEPENAEFLRLEKKVDRALQLQKAKEARMYGKMFG